MRQKLGFVISGIVCIVAVTFPSLAGAQAVTLQEQLTAQYKVAKMGSDTSGYSIVDPGTLLAVQKGGILGVPYSDQSILSTKYEGGTAHSPNTMLSKGIGFGMKKFGKEQSTHLIAVGDKVYPTKIDVNLGKDTVAMNIVECDTCNNADPKTYNKAVVVFQFPKGTLAKASAGDVEDTIGQLLAISDDSQQSGDQQGGQNQAQAQAQGQGQGGQAQQQAEPQTIQMGMTTDQVMSALGKPEKIVNLGPKQLYIYKDMKVTFINGKVADVQ